MLPSLRDEYSVHPPDRRKSARYEFSAAIEIEWCSKKYWGRVRNISCHGMSIELPDLRIECVVRRTIPGHGIGVTVTASSKESRVRYESLLRALAVDLESDLSEGNFEKKTASTG